MITKEIQEEKLKVLDLTLEVLKKELEKEPISPERVTALLEAVKTLS